MAKRYPGYIQSRAPQPDRDMPKAQTPQATVNKWLTPFPGVGANPPKMNLPAAPTQAPITGHGQAPMQQPVMTPPPQSPGWGPQVGGTPVGNMQPPPQVATPAPMPVPQPVQPVAPQGPPPLQGPYGANAGQFATDALAHFGSPDAAVKYYADNNMQAELGWLNAAFGWWGIPVTYQNGATTYVNTENNQTFGQGAQWSPMQSQPAPAAPVPSVPAPVWTDPVAPNAPAPTQAPMAPPAVSGMNGQYQGPGTPPERTNPIYQPPGALGKRVSPIGGQTTVSVTPGPSTGPSPYLGPGQAPTNPNQGPITYQPGGQVPQPSPQPPPPAAPGVQPPQQAPNEFGLSDWIPHALNPAGQSIKANLDNAYVQSLYAYGLQETDAKNLMNLTLSRLAQDQIEVERAVDEQMAARGIYDSGVRTFDQRGVQRQFANTREDEAYNTLSFLNELGMGKADAYSRYLSGLSEAQFNEAMFLQSLGIPVGVQPGGGGMPEDGQTSIPPGTQLPPGTGSDPTRFNPPIYDKDTSKTPSYKQRQIKRSKKRYGQKNKKAK